VWCAFKLVSFCLLYFCDDAVEQIENEWISGLSLLAEYDAPFIAIN
jgi:hypothetical protein